MPENTLQRKTLLEILKTSLPAVVDLSSQTFTWLIEAILIGNLATAALAGVGIAQQVIILTFTILLTFVVGSSIIITRYLGAGDRWQANHVLGQSLIIGIILSVVIALIWYFGAPLIFKLIREKEPVAMMYGVKYITTIAWFAPLIVTNFIALGILRATGETLWSMKINVTVQFINLALDVLLIFGMLGFPRLETLGAGLAVGIAHSTGFFMTLYVLRSSRTSLFLPFMELTSPNMATFRRLIRMGIPTTVEQLVWAIGQLFLSVYAGWLGIVVLATHQVLVRIQSVITMIFFGFGLGSMAMVGKNLGAADTQEARRTGRITGLVGIVAAVFTALILLLWFEKIVSVFTDDPGIIQLAGQILLIFSIIQIPKGVNIVYSGTLRGSAELTWLMWLAVITVIIFDIFSSWIAAIVLGMGLAGIWLVQGLDELTRLILNYWRFNRGKWKILEL